MEAAHFFEGTEKLLEVWFSRQQSDASQGSGDLRTIPRWVRGTWGGCGEVRGSASGGARSAGGNWLLPLPPLRGRLGEGRPARPRASGNEAGAGGARSPGRCGSARRAGAGEGRASTSWAGLGRGAASRPPAAG